MPQHQQRFLPQLRAQPRRPQQQVQPRMAMAPVMARPGQIPGMAPMGARPSYKYTPSARNSGPAEAQQGVVVAGQEPLTATRLAKAPPQEQKQMLGERLFPLIQRQHANLAGKITGMLLEIDNSELLHMLEDQASLQGKVEEAVTVLQAHQVNTEAAKK